MILGNSMVGNGRDNPVKIQMGVGYWTQSDSDIGISLIMIGTIYYPLEKRKWKQTISSRRPINKFYLEAIFTKYYESPSSRQIITRLEYKLPSGETAYVGDCYDNDSSCRRKWILRAAEICKQYGIKINEIPLEPLYIEPLYKRDKYDDRHEREMMKAELDKADIIQLRKKKTATKPKRKPVKCSCKKK